MRGSPYRVIVCDLFNRHKPDHETIVEGFPRLELAVEYARRRVWSSVEQLREAGMSPEQLLSQWQTFGEDCRVVGPDGVVYTARSEIDTFLKQPLPPERADWTALYRSLLPDDFSLTYEWAAGSLPPPHHYEYTITVEAYHKGRVWFWPDYPASTVPIWEVSFHPVLTTCILLYNWLKATGFFSHPQKASAEPAVGGAVGHLTTTADGQQIELKVHLLPDEERMTLHQTLRALIPDMVWQELSNRQRAYLQSMYPADAEEMDSAADSAHW